MKRGRVGAALGVVAAVVVAAALLHGARRTSLTSPTSTRTIAPEAAPVFASRVHIDASGKPAVPPPGDALPPPPTAMPGPAPVVRAHPRGGVTVRVDPSFMSWSVATLDERGRARIGHAPGGAPR
jgi:hypothetical protein